MSVDTGVETSTSSLLLVRPLATCSTPSEVTDPWLCSQLFSLVLHTASCGPHSQPSCDAKATANSELCILLLIVL